MTIPFFSFAETNKRIKPEITKSFEDFFDSGWYILGNQVKNFETQYARACLTNHCVGLSNGLDALFIALKTLDIKEGDEVIVPSNTYIATALAVSYTGAKPVFSEPCLNTYNLDSTQLERSISSKTKAILPVHLYGQACNMDEILKVARKYNLFIVEDNAQAHAATWNRKLTGSFGDINATSFYPGKNLGALGDAGAITTDNSQLALKAETLRNYGSRKKYYNEVIGYNMRMDECQAGFLSVKLKYLEEWTKLRVIIAEHYARKLNGIGDLVLPYTDPCATHVYHQYVIRTSFRNELQVYMTSKGIGTLIHYPIPPHLQDAYQHLGHKEGEFPIAELIAKTCLSIPLYPGLSIHEADYICETIKDFFNQH